MADYHWKLPMILMRTKLDVLGHASDYWKLQYCLDDPNETPMDIEDDGPFSGC